MSAKLAEVTVSRGTMSKIKVSDRQFCWNDQLPKAAKATCHYRGGLKHQKLILGVPEARSQRSRYPRGWCLLKALCVYAYVGVAVAVCAGRLAHTF